MIRLAVSGTYSSGKTLTSMALAHLTGLPRSRARTMRELMPTLGRGQTLESCTAAQLVRLVVMRHTERVVHEKELMAADASFLSDGSSLQEWAYARIRVQVGIDPTRSAQPAGQPVAARPELRFYGEVLDQLGEEFRRHVRTTYEVFVHLANELPMTPDGHRPVNETFRAMADELLIETQRALDLPTVVVAGPLRSRLATVMSAFGLEPAVDLDEAIRLAEIDYTVLDTRLEAVRAYGRTGAARPEVSVRDVVEAMCRFLDDRVGFGDVGCALTGDTTFDSLDIDSLVLVEMAVVMERRFVVSIPDGDLLPTQTIDEAAALVAARRAA